MQEREASLIIWIVSPDWLCRRREWFPTASLKQFAGNCQSSISGVITGPCFVACRQLNVAVVTPSAETIQPVRQLMEASKSKAQVELLKAFKAVWVSECSVGRSSSMK